MTKPIGHISAGPRLAPVTPLKLILGRKKAEIYHAHLTRLTFTGFKLAKMGGWL